MSDILVITCHPETGGPSMAVWSPPMGARIIADYYRGWELVQLNDWPEDFDYWPPNSFLIVEVGNIHKGEQA